MMISLPSKWIKKNKLEKGDEVELEELNRKLVITTESKKGSSEITVNLSSLTESAVRTIVTNVYRAGYNKIIINFNDKAILKIIEDVIENYLIGFEIIKKSQNSCIIENITEPSEDQFDNIFSKIIWSINDLFEITEAMLKKEKRDFTKIEEKIKQFDNLCRRIISKKGIDEKLQLQLAFHSELIHAQREIYHLLRYLGKNPVKTGKEELELLEECKQIFETLKQAYNRKDISLLEKIHGTEKEIIYKKGYNSFKKANPIIVHHLLSTARGLYLATSPLVVLFL